MNFIKNNYETYKATDQIPYIISIWIPFHLLAIAGIISAICYWSWVYLLYMCLGWIIFGGVGTSIMLHRYFSHRSFVINPRLKIPLYWISCMSAQGSPIWWSALHVGYHHSYADQTKDIHSPIHGFWYAYMGWMFSITHNSIKLRSAAYWLRDNALLKFHNNYNFVVWGSFFLLFFIDPMFALWFYIIPVIIDLHSNGLINSVCHTRKIGYRHFQTADISQNVWWLGLFDWGQGWHNNHHYMPKSFDFGTSVSKKWYEFDPCLLCLPFISPLPETKRIFKIWRESCRG